MRQVLVDITPYILSLIVTTSSAVADEPLSGRGSWSGRVDHFLTGAVLARDTDGDGNVDATVDSARFDVTAAQVSVFSTLETAILYWGGSQSQSADACTAGADSEVTLILPAGDTLPVAADQCYCSDGGSTSYDIWICRSDITGRLAAPGVSLTGPWIVSDYAGRIADNGTDNASVALLLVYSDASLPTGSVALREGLLMMQSDSTVLTQNGLQVGDSVFGSLTYYTLEGDPGGSTNERVKVRGFPGGRESILADSVNPLTNPMNQTINTTSPVMTHAVGVDIDRFDIGPALTRGDAAAAVTYSAGTDKWWLVASVVTVSGGYACPITTAPGDVDVNGSITLADVVYMVDFVFRSGDEPGPCKANGDVDCNGRIAPSDIIFLVNHVFRSGPVPCDICRYSPLPCI